jgi:hypothetical protein
MPQIGEGSIQAQLQQHGFDIEDTSFKKQLEREDAIYVHPGCDTGVLSFTVDLVEWKVENGITDTAFNKLLNLMRGQLKLTTLPSTSDEATSTLSRFGLIYKRIDACKCDGMIYYGDRASLSACSKCGAPRYRPGKGRTPWKVLRHFPIIPRLLRSYKSHVQAPLLHGYKDAEKLVEGNDGMWRHPSHCEAWKHIHNNIDQEFDGLHLGAALDGVNPYKSMSTKWSTWVVNVLNYNLPPHLITKPEHIMLALIIPGKKQVKDIDIYLEPLIDELIELWKGRQGVDVSRPIGKFYLLHLN